MQCRRISHTKRLDAVHTRRRRRVFLSIWVRSCVEPCTQYMGLQPRMATLWRRSAQYSLLSPAFVGPMKKKGAGEGAAFIDCCSSESRTSGFAFGLEGLFSLCIRTFLTRGTQDAWVTLMACSALPSTLGSGKHARLRRVKNVCCNVAWCHV